MSMAIPVEERLLPELRALNVAIPRVNQAKDPIGTRHAIAAAAAASASRFVPPTDVRLGSYLRQSNDHEHLTE